MVYPSPEIVFFDATAQDRSFFTGALPDKHSLGFTAKSLQNNTELDLTQVEILCVHVSSIVSAADIKAMPKLRLIACRSTGFDNVDLAASHTRKITVCNVPGYGENSVAEYTFALMLNLSRKILPALNQMESGDFNHIHLTGFDLAGKTLGVIGTGAIGRHVIRIANGFGMQVIGFDPYPNKALEFENNMRYVPFEKLLTASDIITLHAPYTKDNHHLIDAQAIEKMKTKTLIVNTARGELIDTKALATALAMHKLGGAALDVIEGEKILNVKEEVELLNQKDCRGYDIALENLILEKMPNVILSPHNAFNSQEALGLIQKISAENILNFTSNKPQNVVSS